MTPRLPRPPALPPGEPTAYDRDTPVASGGGQLPTIQRATAQQHARARERQAPAQTAARRRARRAGVGARRALPRPGPGRGVAPGLQTHVFVGRRCPRTWSRTSRRPTASGGSSRTRSTPATRTPPRADGGAGAAAAAVRGGRRDRGARGGRRAGVPARRRPRRRQDRHGHPGGAADRGRRGGSRVLVVADRPAAITIGHWTRSIAGFGDGGLRWCVTTWDRLGKVRGPRLRRGDRRRGAHGAAHDHPAVEALEGGSPAPAGSRTRRSSSPPPPPRAHAAGAALPGAGVRRRCTASRCGPGRTLPARPAAHGFHVERGRYGCDLDRGRRRAPGRPRPSADGSPSADPPATLHRAAPWGPVSVTGAPVALTPAERAAYESEWQEFRAEMQLARRGRQTRPRPGRAAAVPAEGRADPGRGHRRLGQGAGRGRAAGRGVGRVRGDRGRPDPRGAAGLRRRGRLHLRARPVRRRRPSGCASRPARRRCACSP